MAQLNADYKDKGVTFLGINSNVHESVDEIKDHAKSNKLDFIILKDHNNVIADKFNASFTPEIYVLNGSSEILYHGRIDDNRRESDVKTKDLRAALDDILSGKKVSVPETKAFGCTIKRVN
jgi:peroxiredoxin